MTRSRLLLLVAGAVVLLLVLGVVLVFSSPFQTWAVRRAIAAQPGLEATVGSVSAGMNWVELTDVRFAHAGAVLSLPKVELEVPLWAAAWSHRVRVSRLTAKGWTLNLAEAATPSAPAPASVPPGSSKLDPAAGATRPAAQGAAPTDPAASAAREFSGIFAQIGLPVDLSVDGVELSGEVILRESRGRVEVTLTGGGMRAGQNGTFDVTAAAALTDPGVKTVKVRGELIAAMDTPRSFTQLAANLDVAAQGGKFPQGVKLHAAIAAARAGGGETYIASVLADGQEVIAVQAALPRGEGTFKGAWKVNVRDIDVAPFALGAPLPAFTAVGEGSFDGDAGFKAIHLAGHLDTNVNRLEWVRPELSAVGELKVVADFDLAQRGGAFAVQKFEADVNGAKPVATVRALQAFQFNPGTGELRTADASHELVGLSLHAVPVAWLAPLVEDVQLEGGTLRGKLSAAARDGGMNVQSTSPLLIDGIHLSIPGQPLVRNVDVALNASADYTPKGWQAEVSEMKVSSGDAQLFSLQAKLGQLVGSDRSIKATGTLSAALPAVLAQPVAAESILMTGGDAAVDFVVSLDAKKMVQANIALTNLATEAETNAVALPSLSTNLRADISPDGKISFNAPLLIEATGRKSDLTIIGSIAPERDRLRAIEATVTSTQLVIDDAQVFAAVLREPAGPPVSAGAPAEAGRPVAVPPPVRDSAPPWAGLHGSLALQLQRIIYSDAVQVSDVTGRLLVDAGTLKLERLQAGLGEAGRAQLDGAVTFHATEPQPYAVAADVAVSQFDPGPWFRAITGQPPTIEGKFDLTSKLDGRAATFADLAAGAGGSFQLTSKGGVFRGLPVDVGNIVESTGKVAAWIASAGTAISAMAGRKDLAEVASKGEAVAELARGLNPISYDQLSVNLTRDAALNTTLREFTLISPELRLTGSGTVLHKPGSCLLEDSLAMELTLRARGRKGELLKYLGTLDPKVDDLGYSVCTMPLRVGGTLGMPDTSELNSQLTALAIEKSGFGDKAAELLNKIRGGK